MGFGKIRNTRLAHDEQDMIYDMCMRYKQLPPKLRQKMIGLCDEIGGEYRSAMFEVLTNSRKTVDAIARDYFTNEKKLYKLRKIFFESFYDEIKKYWADKKCRIT